jgi:SAM-dependent methyltransferase
MTTASDWTGRVGTAWAEEWRRTERAFAALAPHLDAAISAAAAPGPLVALDVGCGVGGTAAALAAARPDAHVIGADLSPDLIAVARARHAASTNLRFHQGDALAVAADHAPLDLIVSRHGVMFFADPVAAFVRLGAATRPGGHLVFTCFAPVADNPWATLITPVPERSTSYVPGPFAFAEPAAGAALLAATGWVDAIPTLVRFTYRVGAGDDPVEDAAAFLTRIGPAASCLRNAAAGDRPALAARLRARLAAQRNGRVVDFPAAAWLWTARATGERP